VYCYSAGALCRSYVAEYMCRLAFSAQTVWFDLPAAAACARTATLQVRCAGRTTQTCCTSRGQCWTATGSRLRHSAPSGSSECAELFRTVKESQPLLWMLQQVSSTPAAARFVSCSSGIVCHTSPSYASYQAARIACSFGWTWQRDSCIQLSLRHSTASAQRVPPVLSVPPCKLQAMPQQPPVPWSQPTALPAVDPNLHSESLDALPVLQGCTVFVCDNHHGINVLLNHTVTCCPAKVILPYR
jgi:hypothetical protein